MSDLSTVTLSVVRQALTRYVDTPSEQILPESVLQDLDVDSLTLAELMFEIEDQLGVSMSDTTSVPKTVADLMTLIEPYVGGVQAIKSAA